MERICKWLLLEKLLGGRVGSTSLYCNVEERKGVRPGYSGSVKKSHPRRMEVEVLGEPRIRRSCLSPRSTPVILEIDICPGVSVGEVGGSKSMEVEWESTHDEVVQSKFFNLKGQGESLQNHENELSVAYLGRQNKRVYLEGGELAGKKISVYSDEFDSTKVNLSKKRRTEDSSSRHLNTCGDLNGSGGVAGSEEREDLILVEEWLFEK